LIVCFVGRGVRVEGLVGLWLIGAVLMMCCVWLILYLLVFGIFIEECVEVVMEVVVVVLKQIYF
jgi:hypothetical protein